MSGLLFVQAVLAGALMWSCFCRLIRTNSSTLSAIRWAIWFMFVAAGLVLAAPVMPLLDALCNWPPFTTPLWVWLVLLLAIVIVQIVTRRHWRDSVPASYRKSCP